MKGKLFYLKRTGSSNHYKYWYWSNKLDCILPNPKPIDKNLINSNPTYRHDPRVLDREFQVGDIIYHLRSKDFAVLITCQASVWEVKARTGVCYQCKEDEIILVASNIYPGKKNEVEPNLLYAKTQEELDFAERLGEIDVTDFTESNLPDIPITKNTLKELHKIWFRNVYIWAGCFRTEPILVGRHNAETLPWEDIETELNMFFEMFAKLISNISEKSLTDALLKLHFVLAWIHPFKDGNGRLIRYFSNLVALQFGYELHWNLSTSRKISQYQKAVKQAVNGDLKALRKIISSSLKAIF